MFQTRHLAALALLCGCATTLAQEPAQPPPLRAPASTPNPRIQWVSAPTGPELTRARIGKVDLNQAREMLSEARNELEPRQWELLDSKLTEAERAWERFDTLARSSGKVAEVAKGVEGAAKAGRTTETIRGIEALRRAGPLLALLILLWPASTAGPEYDEVSPLLNAQMEFEAKLRQVSEAAQRVRSELIAARQVPAVEAVKRDRPPKPNRVSVRDENWKPAPGELKDPPCSFVGGAEPGVAPGWIRCTYVCGKYEVELNDIFGSSTNDCEKSAHLERAKREADNWAQAHDRGRSK